MKKRKIILKEQQTSITAQQELYILNNEAAFSGINGQLRKIIEPTSNRLTPVKVNGKTYHYGFMTKKGNFIVYDGYVITKPDQNLQSTYVKDENGKVIKLRFTLPVDGNQIKTLIQKIGGTYDNNFIYSLLSHRDNLQKYIDNGAVGVFFKDFNDIMRHYYPNDDNKLLKPLSGTNFGTTPDRNLLNSRYDEFDLSTRFKNLKGTIYVPKTAKLNLVGASPEYDLESCQADLKYYLKEALKSIATNNDFLGAERKPLLKRIRECYGVKAYDKDSFSINKDDLPSLEGTYDPLEQGNLRGLFKKLKFGKGLNYNEIKNILDKYPKWALLESKTNSINGKIKKALNEQLVKQKKLFTERKIVGKRLKMIAESYNLKNYKYLTENEKTKLSFLILKEVSFLSKENLINEQLMDFLKSIFGTLLPSGVETIAERIVNSILGSLGLKDTYFRKVLVSALTTNPSELISALKDCKSLTKVIAKSLAEGMAMQLQQSQNLGGGGYDYLRNILGDVLLDQPVIASIEDKISGKICELYNKFSGKSKSVLNTLGGGSAAQLTQ